MTENNNCSGGLFQRVQGLCVDSTIKLSHRAPDRHPTTIASMKIELVKCNRANKKRHHSAFRGDGACSGKSNGSDMRLGEPSGNGVTLPDTVKRSCCCKST
jgi:hypothetical protein